VIVKWYAQLQSCCEKGDDDRDLGDSLNESCVPDGVDFDQARTLWAEAIAYR
jgi:hypothetical protein